MKIAFISNLVETTGGDRILYHHTIGLRKFGHTVDPYFAGWLESSKDNKEGWNSLSNGDIIEYDRDELSKMDFSDYDILIANGLGGAFRVSGIDHPNKAWFCQNYDPYVFGESEEINEIYNTINKYMVYSNDLKKIINYHHGKKKIEVCTNGVEYGKFCDYQKKNFNGSKKICFMVAYYRNYKGIGFANDIFGELKRRGFTTVEVNATVGPLENTMEFYRNPPFEDKCKIVADCDFSIHPSVFETWGLVPMESMAIGTPVVGVNSKGIMEYATDENSVIYKDRDVNLICDTIEELSNNTERYLSIQRKGIETAKKHDWDAIMPEIEQSYYRLMEL